MEKKKNDCYGHAIGATQDVVEPDVCVDEKSECEYRENVAFIKTNLSGEIASLQDCLAMELPDGFKRAIAELINHVALLRGHCLNWLEDHDSLTVNL